VLCGRNAVQVSPSERLRVDFDELGAKLRGVGRVESNAWLLRLELQEPAAEVTVFRDGRAIVKGTDDAAVARSLYARYVGS
jgi:adenylyltransferase/sulfurtransferase